MAIQYAGGVIRNDLYAGVSSRVVACANVNTTLVAAGWTSVALNAFTVYTISTNAVDGNTTTLDGKVYTYRNVLNNANNGEIAVGLTNTETIRNFKAAVNLEAGAGTLYSSATTLNTNLRVVNPTGATIAFPYTSIGSVSCIVEQKVAGLPAPYTVSTSGVGLFSTNTVNWSGFKCSSAVTPQGLQCKYFFYNANDANATIRCVASNQSESELSNNFSGAEQLLNNGSPAVDMRVIANQYQCFAFLNGTVGTATQSFWAIGCPWIPSFLEGNPIIGATGASPIVITTSIAHGFVTGDAVTIRGVNGNFPANVTNNLITVLSTTTFSLDGSIGGGAYVAASGRVTKVGVKIVEAIWSQGTGSSTNFIRRAFDAAADAYWTALNGSTVKDGSGEGSLRFQSITAVGYGGTELAWFGGNFLVTEPLLSFGTSATGIGYLIGQIWDSVICRKAITRDTTGSFDSHNWWNLTDNNTGAAGFMLGSVIHVVP